jgi:hypothetical protein
MSKPKGYWQGKRKALLNQRAIARMFASEDSADTVNRRLSLYGVQHTTYLSTAGHSGTVSLVRGQHGKGSREIATKYRGK